MCPSLSGGKLMELSCAGASLRSRGAATGVTCTVVWFLASGVIGFTAEPETAQEPSFEVASVKRSSSDRSGGTFQVLPGGRFNVTNLPLNRLIARAYGIPIYRVLGGPEWIDADRFDIVATFDNVAGVDAVLQTDRETAMLMLRNLLAERFRLQTHSDMRELSHYALVMATPGGTLGEGIRPATTDCTAYFERRRRSSPLSTSPPDPRCNSQVSFASGQISMSLRTVEMSEFAEDLQRFVGQMVMDETGTIDRFELEVTFKDDPAISSLPPSVFGTAPPDAPSLFDALQEQLGLKLESRLGPVEVLVVDHAEQPTRN